MSSVEHCDFKQHKVNLLLLLLPPSSLSSLSSLSLFFPLL